MLLLMTDTLRTDQHGFRRLHLDEPQLLLLRELRRTKETLLEELSHSAESVAGPVAPVLSPDAPTWARGNGEAWLWDLIDLAPSPAHAALLSKGQIQRVLKAHRLRRVKATEVLACIQAPALAGFRAWRRRSRSGPLCVLATLSPRAGQGRPCRPAGRGIAEGASAEVTRTGRGRPWDVAVVQSLPGVGRKIAAWLFAEAAQPLTERDYQVLRTQGEVAPVTKQSGKSTTRRDAARL